MKYLHLTKGFTPLNTVSSDFVQYKLFIFPGGEPHIQIEDEIDGPITITMKFQSFNDFGKLAVTVDALREMNVLDIHLYIPYLPGARQDRVANPGEAFTCKVYTDLLNSLYFSTVTIVDPHSDVAPALLDNCRVDKGYSLIQHALLDAFPMPDEKYYIVSPDAGANKKIKDTVQMIHEDKAILTKPTGIIKCDKTRDTKTGKITGFEVYADDLQGTNVIIIDDICDGGGTFVDVAEELSKKNVGEIYLAVTHGIFSKGFEHLDDVFKQIYTTDSCCDHSIGLHQLKNGKSVEELLTIYSLCDMK